MREFTDAELAELERNASFASPVPDLIFQLRHARARIGALNESMVRLTRELPYPEEVEGWAEQRAKLVAEVGTLRARVIALLDLVPGQCLAALKEAQARVAELVDALRWAANTVHQAHHTDERSMSVGWMECEQGFCRSIRHQLAGTDAKEPGNG
jgi:hypothetical protein